MTVLSLVSTGIRAEDSDIAAAFHRAGLEGTFITVSLGTGRTISHNDTRAGQRYPIASTFKILNSLIALEENVITPDDVLKWDGKTRDFPDWNRDQTLASAFKVSCVWCYQELASRVGRPAYRHYLKQAAYGELDPDFQTTTFWLDGSLRVSARDQVDLLRKLYLRQLPFRDEHYNALRNIMLAEQTPLFSLRAKTGWAMSARPAIGWYVGYVETARDVWFFATNVDIRDAGQLPLRISLTREALRLKGILPAE